MTRNQTAGGGGDERMNDAEEERNYIEAATPGIINHNLLAFTNTYHCRSSSSSILLASSCRIVCHISSST